MVFTIVAHNTVKILERLGEYHHLLGPGIHFLMPYADSCRHVNWTYLNAVYGSVQRYSGDTILMSDQCYDPDIIKATTKDGVAVEVDTVLYFAIIDPKKAVYQVSNLYASIEHIVETALYAAVRNLRMEELYSHTIEEAMHLDQLSDSLASWGVQIKSLNVQEVILPESIRSATEHIIAEKRTAEAAYTKLEHDLRCKAKAAQHELEEQRTRNVRQVENETHIREMTQRQKEAEALVSKTRADAEAYVVKVTAAATAKAADLAGKSRADAITLELTAISKFDALLPYMLSKTHNETWQSMANSPGSRLILGSPEILATASALPMRQVLASDTT